jgi:hypothetical protein
MKASRGNTAGGIALAARPMAVAGAAQAVLTCARTITANIVPLHRSLAFSLGALNVNGRTA